MTRPFEFTDGDKTRGLLFDFLAFGIVEERLNLQIDDIIEKLGPKHKGPKVKFIMEIVYAGAVNYCDLMGQKVDFNIHDVASWVPIVGLDKMANMIKESIEVRVPKNSKPHPEKVGT